MIAFLPEPPTSAEQGCQEHTHKRGRETLSRASLPAAHLIAEGWVAPLPSPGSKAVVSLLR